MKTRALAWWSGGVASAVACKWAVDTFKDVRLVFIDTKNEHDDTYRFGDDCEKFFGKEIEIVWNEKYSCIQDVWRKYKALNNGYGAVCSSELKKKMRLAIQDITVDYCQIFGFDNSEISRHSKMVSNFPEINAISPLLELNMSKEDCIKEVQSWGIDVPLPYREGYRNNNCQLTGCVRGGIGYWKKLEREHKAVFDRMADMEFELTQVKGKAVTVLRVAKGKDEKGKTIMYPLFLKKHPDYELCLKDAKGREPKSLLECHGFCDTNEQLELDYETMTEIEELI